MGDLFIQGMTKLDLGNLVKQKLQEVLSEETSNKKPTPQQQKFLSRRETASLLHVSLTTLTKLTTSGKLKSYRISKKILYKENEILEALTLINPLKLKK